MNRKDLPLPVLKRQIERMTIMHLRSEKRRLEKLLELHRLSSRLKSLEEKLAFM